MDEGTDPKLVMTPAAPSIIQDAFDLIVQGLRESNPAIKIATSLPNGQETLSIPFVDALSTSLNRLNAEVETYTTKVRKTHNTLLPIHRLPPELFTVIISGSLKTKIRIRRVSRLDELCSISTFWHRTITSTPILWSVISRNDSPQDISKTLHLSRHVALQVDFSGWEVTPDDRYIVSPVIAPVLRSASRWRTAEIRLLPCSVHLLYHLEDSTAPLLEALKINIKSFPRERGEIEVPVGAVPLFAGNAERLRVLHITGIGVPWSAGFMAYLHDLHLGDTFLEVPQLEAIFRNNPNLRHLSIQGVIPPDTADALPPYPIIHHPNIRTLEFPSSRRTPVPYLLPYLEVPNCTTITVALDKPSASGHLTPTSRETLRHAVRHISSSGLQTRQVVWVVGWDCFEFELSTLGDAYQIRFFLPGRSEGGVLWVQAVHMMLRSVTHAADFVLEIGWLNGGTDLDADLLQTFGILPQLKTIVDRSDLRPEITSAMGSIVEVGGSMRWLFHWVEAFVIDSGNDSMDLIPMLEIIRRRYGKDGGEASSTPLAPPPVRLGRFELPEWARGSVFAAEVEGLIGLSIMLSS